MFTKEKIMSKLDSFKTACEQSGNATVETPSGPVIVTGAEKAVALEPVRAAVEKYYARDDALRTQVMYVIHQLYGDLMRRHTIYHDGPAPPPCREDYPPGYDDVTVLFTGNGALPFLAATAPNEFASSIAIDLEGMVSSPLAESWAAQIGTARAGEMAKLEDLLNFCKSGGFEGGLFIAFEVFGKVEMPLKKQDLARMIYQDKGFADLIAVMQLGIFLPSYLEGAILC